MKYAASTKVSADKSRAEIERILTRYGAEGFAYAWHGTRVQLGFVFRKRGVRFTVTLPDAREKRFTHHSIGPRTEAATRAQWDQACRQIWRALALGIKAKLEFIDSGITTFENEFLAHLVTHSGATVAEMVLPQLDRGASPKLLLLE